MIGFIASILGCLVYVVAFMCMVKVYANIDLKESLKPREVEHNLTDKVYHKYMTTYFNFLHTLNIKSIASISTDLFYHSTQLKMRLFNRLGLKQECTFTTGPDSCSHDDLSMTLGNVSWSSKSNKGDYKEQLIDYTTNRILQEKDYKDHLFVMSLNKNPFRQKGEALFCKGCGTEVNPDGEIFVCPACGATYTSDAFDWVINFATASQPAKESKFQQIVGIFTKLVFALPVLGIMGLLVPMVDMAALALGVFVALASIGYFIFAETVFRPLLRLQKYDKLCSMYRALERCTYLLNLFFTCRAENRPALKPFMDENEYERWLQTDTVPSSNFVIEQKPKFPLLKFNVSGGRQHLDGKILTTLIIFNEQTRQLTHKDCTINISFYRNEAVRYQNKGAANIVECKGCGMSVDMTADGKCKYCGTGFDIADFDWKIERLDPVLFV